MEHITFSPEQTEGVGKKFAKSLKPNFLTPVIISLEGELGGGKTTFIKGFARALGIETMIKSPTFVIMRKYELGVRHQALGVRFFYHFDCYRIQKAEDILELGWEEIIKNPKNIIAVEWGDRIKSIMPKDYTRIKFKFIDKSKRKIVIKNRL